MTGAGNVKGQTSRLPPGAADIPLFNRDDYAAPSVFLPQSLLREARRQKALPESTVPPVCVLDPDGDLVAYARQQFGATPSPHWACYHTQMLEWGSGDDRFGIIGFVCMRLGFPLAPMLLGFVLGPMMEENLRRSMLMAGGDPSVFVTRPISLAFIIATVIILIVMVLPAVRQRRGEITG